MSEHLFTSIASIALAIVGLALVAVILSKNANTANVIGSAGTALARDISAAVSPITGGGGIGLGSMYSSGGFTSYGQ